MPLWNRRKKQSEENDGAQSLNDTYVAAVEAQREEKDHFFAHHAYSPLPPEERASFEGLSYWPPSTEHQHLLPLEEDEPSLLTFQTSTEEEQVYTRIGTLRFQVEGEEATLALYEGEEGQLFLPFRDSTSGTESYGAGRYLEPIRLQDGSILVDFNLAYNPYCAYSPDYSCPLPPFENWLKVPIRAGERSYKAA